MHACMCIIVCVVHRQPARTICGQIKDEQLVRDKTENVELQGLSRAFQVAGVAPVPTTVEADRNAEGASTHTSAHTQCGRAGGKADVAMAATPYNIAEELAIL